MNDIAASDRPTTWRVDALSSLEEVRAFLPEWNRFLARQPAGRVPFNEPRVIEHALLNDPELIPRIIVIRNQNDIQCIFPCRIKQEPFKIRFGPWKLASVRLRTLRLFGDSVLFAQGADVQECCRLAFDYLAKRPEFDLMYLEPCVDDDLYRHCTSELARSTRLRCFANPFGSEIVLDVHLEDSFEAFQARMNGGTRRKLRQLVRRLHRDHPDRVKLVKNDRPDQVSSFLDHLDDVFRQTWQAAMNGYRRRNAAKDVSACQLMAEAGWFRSYLLMVDGQPISFLLGFQHANTYYAEETGYVQTLADSSPGAVMMFMVFEQFFAEERPAIYKPGPGDMTQKRAFGNHSYYVQRLFVTPRNRGHVVVSLQHAMDRFQSWAKGILARHKSNPISRLTSRFRSRRAGSYLRRGRKD